MTYGADWFSVVVVLAAAAFVYDYLFVDDEPEEGTVEHAERLWETDQISLAEYERRVELAVDDRAQQIQTVTRSIGGIGPKTAPHTRCRV